MKKVSIFLLVVLFSALVAMVAHAQPAKYVKEKTEQSAAIATATNKSLL